MAGQSHRTLPTRKIAGELADPSSSNRSAGNRRPWVKERRSAVLALPSTVSPADTNFLLNPLHPDFKRIRIASPIDFEFDSRLVNR